MRRRSGCKRTYRPVAVHPVGVRYAPSWHGCLGAKVVCLYGEGGKIIRCAMEGLIAHGAGGIAPAASPVLAALYLVLPFGSDLFDVEGGKVLGTVSLSVLDAGVDVQ